MIEAVSFQTRARTIDHLGREQIADVPTAVSELWKNAYDAYARNVSLHIFADDVPVAAIFDDGVGMSSEQFISNWLVVGTESKIAADVPVALRKGLSPRPKQGQKGIGRLSVAALGSTVLVVTRQEGKPFTACLIDWRLFENPFLYLADIRLPVVEFDAPSSLSAILPDLKSTLLLNIDGDGDDQARSKRITSAWQNFDRLPPSEIVHGFDSGTLKKAIEADVDYERYLAEWDVWNEKHASGTALVMSDINAALSAWTLTADSAGHEDAESIRDSLKRTLTGFSDPYSPDADTSMDYEVVKHTSNGPETVVKKESGYGIDFLKSLDHFMEGEIDDSGIFRGRVRAFGKDLGAVELVPASLPPTALRDRVGPFSIVIGAFEPQTQSSILAPDVLQKVADYAAAHAGLTIYRDGLRVMPYGRPENDFFKIELRRQMHAGREFWAARRLFGRIAITRQSNPNLRDKAGREGLIDNTASRAIQLLVIDILRTAARRYFGSDSPIRSELLPAIEAENNAAADKAKAARTGQLNQFRNQVRQQSASLIEAETKLAALQAAMNDAENRNDEVKLLKLAADVDGMIGIKSNLRLPPRPKNLGNFEDRYREYRDRYATLSTQIDAVRSRWAAHSERLTNSSPEEIARSRFGHAQQAVNQQITKWHASAAGLLRGEISRLDERATQDRKEFYKAAAPLIQELSSGRMSLNPVMSELDAVRNRIFAGLVDFYEPYIRSLSALADGIDLDTALSYAGARQTTLEKRLEQIYSLAQIGISVEIVGHELATLQRRLTSSLAALEQVAPNNEALNDANLAGSELAERLRFLSQMQIASGDIRQKISGARIVAYLKEFFHGLLEERGITLKETDAFLECSFEEFPSRIYPVFINIINNSIYWIADKPERTILLDAGDGTITISDTGPGIDKDDVPNLFELFFTRRSRGRGVGLFLCRQTLAAGGHEIEYVTSGPEKKLQGANFAITLRNGFDG